MAEGFVYLFRADNGLIKIGLSKDPLSRLRAFATGPAAVELLHQICSEDAGWLETQLHRRFRDCRVRGEWFRLADADLASLLEMKRCNRGDIPEVQLPRPEQPLGVSARISPEVYLKAKAVAEYRGVSLGEYLGEIIDPIVRRDLRQVVAEGTANPSPDTPST